VPQGKRKVQVLGRRCSTRMSPGIGGDHYKQVQSELKSFACEMEVSDMSAVEIRPRLDVEEKPHCGRCDSEGRRLIKFTSPNGETHYLCSLCMAQEDKRQMKFSPSWKRSRRPARVH
jgi:hypothetical protein